MYRDPQPQGVDHPRGPDGERDGDHHEDQRKPVDLLQTDPQILGRLGGYWGKGQQYLGRTTCERVGVLDPGQVEGEPTNEPGLRFRRK